MKNVNHSENINNNTKTASGSMYASTVNLSMNEKVYVFDEKINPGKHFIQNLASVEGSNKQIDKLNSSESLVAAAPQDMNLRVARRDDVQK